MRQINKIFALALIVLSFTSCASQDIFSIKFLAMDTVVEVTIVCESEKVARQTFEIVSDRVDQLDLMFSKYKPDSFTSLINQNAGIEPVAVSPEMLTVLEAALEVSANTDGAFDVTIGPLITLWDILKGPHKPPAAEEINALLSVVDYKDILISKPGKTVMLRREGMSIDLGGIAKGFIINDIIEKLKKQNISAALVNIGGDIKAYGKKPDGRVWKIGIQHPRADRSGKELFTTLPLPDEAIATSGDYQRFFEWEGKRYHHIVDPHTGYPSDRCISVSVITKNAMLSDALATAVFVMGSERGKRYLAQRPDARGIIIVEDKSAKDGLRAIRVNQELKIKN